MDSDYVSSLFCLFIYFFNKLKIVNQVSEDSFFFLSQANPGSLCRTIMKLFVSYTLTWCFHLLLMVLCLWDVRDLFSGHAITFLPTYIIN